MKLMDIDASTIHGRAEKIIGLGSGKGKSIHCSTFLARGIGISRFKLSK